jgi:glycosyltransferase involved in cell wall biosynthesis
MMGYLTIHDLPAPPSGKTGWPWTVETVINGKHEIHSPPLISIVTPSYNQGQFFEETIRSVLLQGYRNLEYIVVDGGSSDNSVEIIQKYSPWLTRWLSEPDRGQSHALNKGLSLCSGDLVGWINSDDMLLPGALFHLATLHQRYPSSILLADVVNRDECHRQTWRLRQRHVTFKDFCEHWRRAVTWHQPGTFFPLSLYRQVGTFDEGLCNLFDWEWMCRALQIAPVQYLDYPVALFRYHGDSKTFGDRLKWIDEKCRITQRYFTPLLRSDSQLANAILEMVAADSYLMLHGRDRNNGVQHLRKAVETDYRVLKWKRYWLLWAKAILPLSLLHFFRSILKSF